MTPEQKIIFNHYPKELKAILEVIQSAIDSHPGKNNNLAFIITEQIRRHYGGTTLYIANGTTFDRLLRDFKIRQERASGASINRLAHKYNLTDRQVFNILADGG